MKETESFHISQEANLVSSPCLAKIVLAFEITQVYLALLCSQRKTACNSECHVAVRQCILAIKF